MEVTFSFVKFLGMFSQPAPECGRRVLSSPVGRAWLLLFHKHTLLCFPILNLSVSRETGSLGHEQMLQPLFLVSYPCGVYSAQVRGPSPSCLLSLLRGHWDQTPNLVSRQKNSGLPMICFLNYEHLEGSYFPIGSEKSALDRSEEQETY